MSKADKPADNRRAMELQKLIEDAQRQPGLDQVLQLIEQANQSLQALRDSQASAPFVGGASVGHTTAVYNARG